jgi:uncharacterized protein (TIGR01777 family)
MKSKKVVISGASGLIGSKLVTALELHGHSVSRLVRRQPVGGSSDIYWNYETRKIDTARLEGIDVVIHLAGKPLDEQRWTPKIKKAIYDSRIKGTAFLSESLAQLVKPPYLLISASATDYYAECDGPIGESDGQPGHGFVSEMCQDWEAAAEAARRAGIRVVMIRIPSVLAAEGHSMLGTFLPMFKRGFGFVLGSGRQLMCFVTRDDMIRAIEHLIGCEQIAGPVNVLAPEVVTNREFAEALGRVLHRPVFLKIPGFVLRVAMGEIAESILAGDTHLRPDKLLATGFRFESPDIESALRHELELLQRGNSRHR